jgi:hypothetical protein
MKEEWHVATIRKIVGLFVLGVVLALVTAPAFAQEDLTQAGAFLINNDGTHFPRVDHDTSMQ